jgi:hypothetical protein
MSYILEALKKDEYQREMAQFIDYDEHFKQKKGLSISKGPSWKWIGIMLIMNVLSFTALLWPKKPLSYPQVYIVSPTVPQSLKTKIIDIQKNYLGNKKENPP